jgi:hypothetical protein
MPNAVKPGRMRLGYEVLGQSSPGPHLTRSEVHEEKHFARAQSSFINHPVVRNPLVFPSAIPLSFTTIYAVFLPLSLYH